jgi:hypothetical protein
VKLFAEGLGNENASGTIEGKFRRHNGKVTWENPRLKPILAHCGREEMSSLRFELPVSTLDKGTVSEYLGASKAATEEHEGKHKRGLIMPAVTACSIPPIGQIWTGR